VHSAIRLTPIERLVVFSLTITAGQTAEQIFKPIGTKTFNHLKVAVRSLTVVSMITATTSPRMLAFSQRSRAGPGRQSGPCVMQPLQYLLEIQSHAGQFKKFRPVTATTCRQKADGQKAATDNRCISRWVSISRSDDATADRDRSRPTAKHQPTHAGKLALPASGSSLRARGWSSALR
jgi:hypothetical protein